MKIRLLSPGIYLNLHDDVLCKPESYPVVVEARIYNEAHPWMLANNRVVGGNELKRAFPGIFNNSIKEDYELSWRNEPGEDKEWENVSPFDFWNELKRAGREVGDKPRKGYL